MKKLYVLASVLMLAVLVLSACGGANNNGNNVIDETPGVVETLDTGVGAVSTETPSGLATAEATPTLAVTDVVPTTGAGTDVTATTAAGTDATAAVPVTGDDTCRPYLLKNLLDYEVVDSTGNELAEVDAVVIYRDADNFGVTGAGTPDLTAVTPDANAGAQIAYLVVDFDDAAENGDKQTLIPFTAFTPLSTETALEDCRFVFAGDYSLDGVPVFDPDNLPDVDVNDWDNEIASFWNNLGVYVGAGADESAALGNPVVLRAEFQDINVTNAAGDDLGEVEDFVINPESGVLTHAVLETGGFLGIGNKRIPVPMNRVVWGDFDDDNADLGEMIINIADDAWENAPVVDDLDDIDFGNPDWDVDFDTYWEGIK